MGPRAERIAETRDGPVLQGISCSACGARSFPPARWCRNCHSADIAVIPLATKGRIETAAGYEDSAFGEIRLSDGMLVAGRIEPASKAAVGKSVIFSPAGEIVRFQVDD